MEYGKESCFVRVMKGKWKVSYPSITSAIVTQIMVIIRKRKQFLPQKFQAWCQGYFNQLLDLQLVIEKLH